MGTPAIVNTAALRLAGITAETHAPFGGEILKDKATGQPTGMLIDNAKELVARYIPAASAAEKEDALLRGVKREIELGWCEIQNPGSDVAEVEIMRRLFDTGQLKLRIYNAVSGPGDPADQLLTEGASIGTNGGRFTQRTIKFLCRWSARLARRGAPREVRRRRHFRFSHQQTGEPAPAFSSKRCVVGIQVQTHAIGDRANRIVLDLYDKAFKTVPPNERKVADPRWRIEHAQIVSPQDIPRFAKLGIIPSMQPSHAISDLYFAPSQTGASSDSPARMRGRAC